MADITFKKGDVVKLKSGGELMTIENFAYDDANQKAFTDQVICVWFENKKLKAKYSTHLL